jgi:pimeloyl-ACP methyl ester carboxylesterase
MTLEIERYRLRHRLRPIDVLVAGDGPPLVLLHGWGLSARAYHRSILALADLGYRVAAPTVTVQSNWTVEAVAEIAAEAMAAVEAAPAPLVGHSFGGVVAAHMTTAHPDFVTALVPVSAPLVSLGSLRLGRIVLPGRHYRIVAHGPTASALMRAAVSPSGLPSLLRSARWFLGKGHDAPLAQIAATDLPRAVVWASHDAVLPRAVAERSAELLRAPLVIVERDEGWPGREHPDHDWPFRHPAHFAATIDRVLSTDAVPRRIDDVLGRDDERGTTA